MKKPLIIMGCTAAVILMSSCTADNIEGVKNENSKNNNQIPVSATTDTPLEAADTTTGVDDRDKVKT